MHDCLCHFARGFFRGWRGALCAHHHEIHMRCHIDDVVSRMTLPHKLLHAQSCQSRVLQQLLQDSGLFGYFGCEDLWGMKHVRPPCEGGYTCINHVQYLERSV